MWANVVKLACQHNVRRPRITFSASAARTRSNQQQRSRNAYTIPTDYNVPAFVSTSSLERRAWTRVLNIINMSWCGLCTLSPPVCGRRATLSVGDAVHISRCAQTMKLIPCKFPCVFSVCAWVGRVMWLVFCWTGCTEIGVLCTPYINWICSALSVL